MQIKKGADILLQLKDFLSRFKILLQRKVVKTSKSPHLEETVFNENKKIASHPLKPDSIDSIVNNYHQLRTIDKRPMEDIIQYDKLGLPK